MQKAGIKKIAAREILDSRGFPTVEATVVLESDAIGQASVPSGASVGKFEAVEKRDGDATRFGGKGVLCAVLAVHRVIAPALLGKNAMEQTEIDEKLCALDGTEDLSALGANATLAVSLAVARAAAAHAKQPLYRYLGGICATRLPTPMFNVINGGAHAKNPLDVQEFMLMPTAATTFGESLRIGAEIYHVLGDMLNARGLHVGVGDEGGFAPDLTDTEQALELLVGAIGRAGYAGQVQIALDAAASEWWQGEAYHLPKSGRTLTASELIARYESLANKYPIASIEDGLSQEDPAGWQALTKALGKKLLLVGDDLFATNKTRLCQGAAAGLGNAILIKPNQNGTLTGTLETVREARRLGYKQILSHRSGETEDTSICDIAVATNAPLIKAGAPCRGERTAKYNRLLRIEAALLKKTAPPAFSLKTGSALQI